MFVSFWTVPHKSVFISHSKLAAMASILNKGIIIRRFKYMKYTCSVDELHKIRKSILPIPPVHPSQIREGRHFVRDGGIISASIEMKPKNSLELIFGKLKGVFYWNNPNGINNGNDNDNSNNNRDRSNEMTRREEEVRKLQETRERDIQHKFELESIWKSMKERDTLLRRDKNDKDRDDDKSDK